MVLYHIRVLPMAHLTPSHPAFLHPTFSTLGQLYHPFQLPLPDKVLPEPRLRTGKATANGLDLTSTASLSATLVCPFPQL